jgi:hypothetical protein
MPRCLGLTFSMFRCIVLTASLWLPGLFGMGYPAPAWSQTPGDMSQLRQDITAIKQGQDALRKELEEIKSLFKIFSIFSQTPDNTKIFSDCDSVREVGGKLAKIWL